MNVMNPQPERFAARTEFNAAQTEDTRASAPGSRPRRRYGRRLLLAAALAVGLVTAVSLIRGKHGASKMETPDNHKLAAVNEEVVITAAELPNDTPMAAVNEEAGSSTKDQPNPERPAAPGTALRVLKATSEITSVAFSADGKRALSGDAEQVFRVWDLETGKEKEASRKTFRLLEKITFAPDGSRFAGRVMQNIDVYDTETGKAMLSLNSGSPHTGPKAFARTGRRVIMGKSAVFGEPYALVWDLESGKTFRSKGQKEAIRIVGLSADGKQALSAGDDGLYIWEVESGKELRRLDRPTVVSAIFSPDGKQVLTGEVLGSLTLWEVATGKEVKRFEGHTKAVTGLAYSADATRLVSGSLDRTVRVWDVSAGKETQRFEGHEDGVTCLALAEDGVRVLSGGKDRTIRLWQISREKR